MSTSAFMSRVIQGCCVLGLFLLVGPLPAAKGGRDVPDHLLRVIEERFPGAVINEVEKENWKGKQVIEFELTARDGIEYEVFVSESGEIVKIEEED